MTVDVERSARVTARTTQAKASMSPDDHVASWTPPRFFKVKRMMLAIAGALANINIWTGAPALALWVGAQTHEWAGGRAPGTGISMQSILIVVVVLAVLELALVQLVTKVSDAYDKLTDSPRSKTRRVSPWLRSLSGEREKSEVEKYGVSAIERIAIISVVVCVLLFEAWFFFSPRSALPY
jgi:hypothetical protein